MKKTKIILTTLVCFMLLFSLSATVYGAVPDVPTIVTPVDGATNVEPTTTLTCHIVDLDGDTMNVSFYWTDDTLIQTLLNQANDSDVVTSSLNLDYNTLYTWYVIANDSTNENQSTNWTFTTRTIQRLSENFDDTPRIIIVTLTAIILFLGLIGYILKTFKDKTFEVETFIKLLIVVIFIVIMVSFL